MGRAQHTRPHRPTQDRDATKPETWLSLAYGLGRAAVLGYRAPRAPAPVIRSQPAAPRPFGRGRLGAECCFCQLDERDAAPGARGTLDAVLKT